MERIECIQRGGMRWLELDVRSLVTRLSDLLSSKNSHGLTVTTICGSFSHSDSDLNSIFVNGNETSLESDWTMKIEYCELDLKAIYATAQLQ